VLEALPQFFTGFERTLKRRKERGNGQKRVEKERKDREGRERGKRGKGTEKDTLRNTFL